MSSKQHSIWPVTGHMLNFDMESNFFAIGSADNAINAELKAVKGRAALHPNGTIKTTYVLASTKLFVHLLIPFSVRKSMNRELNRYNCHTYRISFCETFCAAWGWPILNGAAPLHHEIPLIQDRKSLSGFHVQIVDVLAGRSLEAIHSSSSGAIRTYLPAGALSEPWRQVNRQRF